MNAQQVIEKAKRGENLTVEEVKIYQQVVKPQKQVYGKYGTLALKYMEEHNVGKLWAIENLPEYLHGIDRQADELNETMYAKLSKDARYERVSDFLENFQGKPICSQGGRVRQGKVGAKHRNGFSLPLVF